MATAKDATRKTRQAGELLDPDIDFPALPKFKDPNKLPTTSDVIGVLRYLLDNPKTNIHYSQAFSEVKKMIYSKWYHDTVYCITSAAIAKRIEKEWNIFKEGRKRIRSGRKSGKAVDQYKQLKERSQKLFDVAASTHERLKQCEVEFGVKMSQNEVSYLEDQRSVRKMECDKGVDTVWYTAIMKKERQREFSEKYKREMENTFRFVDIDQICDILGNQGEISADNNEDALTLESQNNEEPSEKPEVGKQSSRRRQFTAGEEESEDELPPKLRHVRLSERIVRDDVYETLADLKGLGLSTNEASQALIKVANNLFNRKWKMFDEDNEKYDLDTLPHPRNMRNVDELIEAKSLACISKEIEESSQSGRMITHATDSTTKKGVGQFAVAGIHIGQNVPFPLPLIPVSGETTKDIADQCSLMCKILAVVSEKSEAEVYEQIDAHMTDSTEHNKGFAEIMKDMYDLETTAGQLFCGTHTTLGFSSAMNKQLSLVERDMTLEAIFQNFMVDLDFDSKHGSVAGQALDCMLRLVAPEYQHKPWNYYKEFVLHLDHNAVDKVLFAYKDHRFGCLSRAAAVLVYLLPWMEDFLECHQSITNRLACIVRGFLEVEYLKPAFCVFAAFGVQLVEPFYSTTISKGETHSDLQIFYQTLHDQLGRNITPEFFTLQSPLFDCVSPDLFEGVKKSYNIKFNVVSSVATMSSKYLDDCLKLANLILPELKTVLGRQRRDYGISEQFPAQYPIQEQASNVDDTPVTNIAMERLCGSVDYRIHKLKQLEAVSRSIILQETEELRRSSEHSFREFTEQAQEIKELKLSWNKKMSERFEAGASEKEAIALAKESKKLDLLEKLKAEGGPFTTEYEVDHYMSLKKDKAKKQKRMKMEVQFARESSQYLPKTDPLFRIQITLPSKKRRDKTADEFAVALKALLGCRNNTSVVTLEQFRVSLKKVYNAV